MIRKNCILQSIFKLSLASTLIVLLLFSNNSCLDKETINSKNLQSSVRNNYSVYSDANAESILKEFNNLIKNELYGSNSNDEQADLRLFSNNNYNSKNEENISNELFPGQIQRQKVTNF